MTVLFSLRGSAAVLLVGWLLSGCSEGPAASSSEAPAVAQEVGVIELQPAPQAVIRELPGRIAPTRIAEVRARVSGIVVNRNFEQGSDVKIGDVLYELDARPFEIEVEVAEAALRKATAVLNQERKNARRMEVLAPIGAAAQSQLDVAIASVGQAEADVAARKADVARAKLNIEYTRICAPISGRIGRAHVTEGALVGQLEPTHVATIQRLDPIYADFTQSAAELNELRREFDTGELQQIDSTKVRLILNNGGPYPYEGKLLFSGTTVDPGTGQVTLRASSRIRSYRCCRACMCAFRSCRASTRTRLRCRNRPFAAMTPAAVKCFSFATITTPALFRSVSVVRSKTIGSFSMV
jgi:membrane fusion protein, multidrug efflux system